MNILFTKYNNNRLPKYQLETSIYEFEGLRKVRKRPLTNEGLLHINNIYDNTHKTSVLYKEIQVLVPEIFNNELHYPFIYGKSWSDILLEYIREDNKIGFVQKLKCFISTLAGIQSGVKKNFVSNEKFNEVFGCDLVLEEIICVNPANIDMTFDNIIDNGEVPILIDCEWVYPFEIPISYILYRSLYSFWTKHQLQIRPYFEIEELYHIAEIDSSIVEQYDKMEQNFQRNVHGQNALEKYKRKSYSTQSILKLINEHQYYSYAYLPVNMEYKFVEEVKVDSSQTEIRFHFTDPCEDHVRFDLIRKPALVELKSIKIVDQFDVANIYELCDSSNDFEGLTFSEDVKILSKEGNLTVMFLTEMTHIFLKLKRSAYHGFKLILEVKLIQIVNEKIVEQIEHEKRDYETQLKIVQNEVEQYKNKVEELRKDIEQKKMIINDLEDELSLKNKQLNEITESKYWKITSPIRKVHKIFNTKE